MITNGNDAKLYTGNRAVQTNYNIPDVGVMFSANKNAHLNLSSDHLSDQLLSNVVNTIITTQIC